ncbi:MAG: ABC transporter substrate-binding protein [Gammaproteobacteria bacterium]|nr:ABC transporter substrate-binding protein [Gammaproteobacteria bacterium]
MWHNRAMQNRTRRMLLALIPFLTLFLPALASADAVDAEAQAVTIALTQEPPNLDSTRTTDLVSFFVIGHVGEGLLRYDRRGRLAPGVAERWEVAPERIVFHLRDDARWSDGSRVVADDFVYAWSLINDPEYAAPYATIMYPIKNAEAIQNGELPLTELGVSAQDRQTLVVDLQSPCGYCLSLMVHAAFYP